MQAMDDMALLREYATRHSEVAFEELVKRRIGFVYSAALRQVREPHLAEEVAQAVFVILAQKAGKISGKTILTGWLFKTTRFTALAQIRAVARRQRQEKEVQMQIEFQSAAAGEIWNQISPLLDEALAALGEKDRQAVLLRFIENKSLADVGSCLGLGEDTARKRVSRALEKLHHYFNRRGISSTTAIIAGEISANSIQFVPATLAKSVTAVAVAKGAAASTSTLTLIKGALKIMAWTKAKMAIVAGVSVLLAVGTTSVVVVQKESLIDGKTESEWIASIVYRGDDKQVRLWHSLGPKGIQMLLRAMKPSPVVLTYERTLDRHETVSYAVLTNGIAGIGIQERAGFLLFQLADKYDVNSAVPRVIKLLKTEKDDDVRATELLFFETPIQTMSEKEKATLLPELVRSLKGSRTPAVLAPYDEYTNSISDVRNNALCLLPYYQDQKETIVPLIINAMKDPNPLVRMTAVKALNQIDPQNAASSEFVPVLVGCLTSSPDANLTAVNESAILLGEFHRKPDLAVPALIQNIQNPYPWIRANSAWALGRFGDEAKSAIPALTKALKDSDASVRRQATRALERIETETPAN